MENIIVLDEFGTPLAEQRDPVDGDLIIDTRSGERVKTTWPIPIPPTITNVHAVVTSVLVNNVEQNDDYRLTFPTGSSIVMTVELRNDNGDVLPVNDLFIVPLEGKDGSRGRCIKLLLENGVATVRPVFNEDGEWHLNEEGINRHIPAALNVKYNFPGLYISVYEE